MSFLQGDPVQWLAAREEGIPPAVASCIRWAGAPHHPTDLAILYLHGFSASPMELHPLPHDIAADLGANLLSFRLTGHGMGPDGLARARADDWWADLLAGIAICRHIGRRIVLLGMSCGATLCALAARHPQLALLFNGTVLISPNFRIRGRNGHLLDLPFARTFLWVLGNPQREFRPRSDRHAEGWTSRYPISASLPVGALLRCARKGNYAGATAPALFIWSDADRIVDHRASQKVADGWGGPKQIVRVVPGALDDPDSHVIAGDILSPAMTRILRPIISDWVAELP